MAQRVARSDAPSSRQIIGFLLTNVAPRRRKFPAADVSHMTTHREPAAPVVIYTAEEVAALLRLSKRTVERATTAGLLPYRKTGVGTRCRRYTGADIDAYLATMSSTSDDGIAVQYVPAPRRRARKNSTR